MFGCLNHLRVGLLRRVADVSSVTTVSHACLPVQLDFATSEELVDVLKR